MVIDGDEAHRNIGKWYSLVTAAKTKTVVVVVVIISTEIQFYKKN